MQKFIKEKEFDFLKEKTKVIAKSERFCILGSISNQPFTYFKLDSIRDLK